MNSSARSLKYILVTSALALLILASFGGGVIAERYAFHPRVVSDGDGGDSVSAIGQDTSVEPKVDVARIEEILKLLDEEYYYGPIDREERLYDALEGLVNGLPDNYTVFLPPEESKISRQSLSGEYEGIGIWIDMVDGRFTVVSPMKGSPAEEAGILPGDVILSVDGVSLDGLTQDEAVRRVRGPAGTPVHLVVERAGIENPLIFDVERAKIATPSVSYELTEDGVAHISVSVFGDRTTSELDRALTQAMSDQSIGIVLDLRSNGGGWVSAAQEMIGRFVPADSGAAYFEATSGDAAEPNSQPILEGEVREFALPLVLLTNGGTASASEIVAGALQDFDRATLIGTKTFGKGSIQRVHSFSDGSSVRITSAEWLTPTKRRIQDVGIEPHIVVEQPDGASDEQDVQLERAIRFLVSGE